MKRTPDEVLNFIGNFDPRNLAASRPRSSGVHAEARLLDHGHDHGHVHRVRRSNTDNVVSKGVLKAKMLEYFRRVEETGDELVVTDNGVPVLRVVPIRTRKSSAELFGDARGRVVYRGDLLAPTTDEWPET